ncbi:MAG: hypothetical protein ACTTIZ_03125 [Treponema sp.]
MDLLLIIGVLAIVLSVFSAVLTSIDCDLSDEIKFFDEKKECFFYEAIVKLIDKCGELIDRMEKLSTCSSINFDLESMLDSNAMLTELERKYRSFRFRSYNELLSDLDEALSIELKNIELLEKRSKLKQDLCIIEKTFVDDVKQIKKIQKIFNKNIAKLNRFESRKKFFSYKKNIAVFILVLLFCAYEVFGIGKDWVAFRRYDSMPSKFDDEIEKLGDKIKFFIKEVDKSKEISLKKIENISKERKDKFDKLRLEVDAFIVSIDRLKKESDDIKHKYEKTNDPKELKELKIRGMAILREIEELEQSVENKKKYTDELMEKNSNEIKILEAEVNEKRSDYMKKVEDVEMLFNELIGKRKLELEKKYKEELKKGNSSIHLLPSVMAVVLVWLLLTCLLLRWWHLKEVKTIHKEMERLVSN